MFPFHTWLPLAHVQAPTAGSVFLAGILLKIGTYGFLRFNLPLLPTASAVLVPWVVWLAVIGIIYGALVALAQIDMKRLIAYSSVSHLGFCMLGLFALNPLGVQGAALQMVNHGISTGALFALVGMLYERYHTREIARAGWSGAPLTGAGFFHGVVHAVQHRSARVERLCGRDPDLDRGLSARLVAARARWKSRCVGPPCWPSAAWFWEPGTCSGWCSECSSDRCENRATDGEPVTDLVAPGDRCSRAVGDPRILDWDLSQVLPGPNGSGT